MCLYYQMLGKIEQLYGKNVQLKYTPSPYCGISVTVKM